MNLIKYGIASVVLTCAVAVACGGSSSSNGNGSGAGTSNGSGGTSNSAGTTSSGAGTRNGTGGTATNTTGGTATSTGGTATGAGGTLTGIGGCDGSGMLPPAASTMCPTFVACAEKNCATQLKACDATGFENCAISNCFNEALTCGSMGTGGNGAGGSLSFGGNAGTFPSFDAGTQTCADLAPCCAKQTDAQLKSQCDMIVAGKLDFACSIAFSSLSCG